VPNLPRLRIAGPGVTVNESAILGAEVIVLKDLKPWMIVMKNTARD
jgi:acetyltransferase-like isoleucine patch superfamily enzyme